MACILHYYSNAVKEVDTMFRFSCAILLFVLVVAEVGCSYQPEEKMPDDKPIITIATGGTTGPYFAIANGMVNIFNRKLSQVNPSIRSSGGGVENIKLLVEKEAELGLVMADIASFAYEGDQNIPGFSKGENLRAIAALYPNFIHIITLNKSLTSIADLKGKKIGVGDVGSGTEVNARTILNANGISYDDIDEFFLSYRESIIELKADKIDAAFLTSGLPNPMIKKLSQERKIYFIPIDIKSVTEISKRFPYYTVKPIPEDTYVGQYEEVNTVAITNLLLTRNDISEELIYQIARSIFDNAYILQLSHDAARSISIENSQEGLTVPLHPGAKKYFQERGVTTLSTAN